MSDPATSEWQKWRYSIHLFASLGELSLARGDHDGARRFAEECLERGTRTNSRRYLARGWRLAGEIATERRQWNDADEALRRALAIAQQIGNPTQLWRTHLVLGRLHDEQGQREAARAAYRAARDVIDRVKESLQTPPLRASLEQARFIRIVYDLANT